MPHAHHHGRRAVLALGAALVGLRSAPPGQAQEPVRSGPPAAWPQRPVRLINSGAPGSGIDLMARLLGQGLAHRLGQPFPVENRAGAGMLLAGEAHAQARPGESLLLLAATGIASTVPFTQAGPLPYDPVADLVPVALIAEEFLCLAVPAASPAGDVAGLLAAARLRPGALNWYSVPGFMELAFRLFLHEQRLDMGYVAYRGSPPAVLDLVAGRIEAAILPLTPALASINDGRLRALAVTATRRAPALAHVPTMVEAGFPGLRYDSLTGLFGWRGMPDGIRNWLAVEVATLLLASPQDDRLAAAGIEAQPGSPDELAAVIAQQRAQVQAALRVLGPLAQR